MIGKERKRAREERGRDERDIWTPSVPSSLPKEVVSELQILLFVGVCFLDNSLQTQVPL